MPKYYMIALLCDGKIHRTIRWCDGMIEWTANIDFSTRFNSLDDAKQRKRERELTSACVIEVEEFHVVKRTVNRME